jgi:hypothetical protein
MIVIGLLATMVGCFPEKRVVWSPNGEVAAVIGKDGLHLCGRDGKLSDRVAEGVQRAAWLPDSRHLVLAGEQIVKTWADMATCFPAERREALTAIAERMCAEVLAHEGPLDDLKVEEFEKLREGEQHAVLLYLREKHADALAARLGDKWAEVKAADIKLWVAQTAELAGREIKVGKTLVRSADEIVSPRVSPNGRLLAYVGPPADETEGTGQLLVVPLDGSAAPRVVGEYVSMFPDWSADGKALVYARSAGGLSDSDMLALGSISQRTVCDEAGALLDEFPDQEDLAGVVFQAEVRVRSLPDGRIIFSAMEMHLPCATTDLPTQATLFMVDPGHYPLVMRVAPRQAEAELANAAYFFEVSPDGQHVAVPGSSGEMCVLTLATGKVLTVIGGDEAHGGLAMVPNWRTADELCCVLPPADGSERATVVLCRIDWAAGQVKREALSTDWPEAPLRGFLLPDSEDKSD